MSELGSSLGSIFSSIGPAMSGAVNTLGSDVGSLFSGSGLEGALGGLFGGGSSAVTGAIPDAGSIPGAAAPMAQIGANIGTAAQGVGQDAASLMAGPGISTADAINAYNPVGSAIMGAGGGLTPTSGIDTIGASAVPGAGTGLASANPTGDVLNPTAINPGQVSLAPGVPANPTGLGNPNFLQRTLQSLGANPKLLGEGGLLAAELLNANRTPAGEAQIKALAGQQGAFAKNQGELAMAEQSGILPSGATQMFQGVMNANLAAVRAKYASMGMTGSTAEMEDLQSVRDATMAQMFQTGQQMAQTGWTNVNQATGYQSQLLDEILASETAQGTQLGQALAAFAGAAAK